MYINNLKKLSWWISSPEKKEKMKRFYYAGG